MKKWKPGPTPKCRGCRAEQREGKLCVSVTGLYVPFEQNFVTETIFYFCPAVTCIQRIPVWTNLNVPLVIHVDGSVNVDDGDVNLGNIKLVRH